MLDEISKQVTFLQKQNEVLRSAVNGLLEEEDVKMIPGYDLIKTTYESMIEQNVRTNTEHVLKAGSTNYDPLHAPPGARKGKHVKTQMTHLPAVSKQSGYSRNMPDMNVCMLDSPDVPAKTKVLTKVSVTKKTVAKPVKTENIRAEDKSVYVVEIKGAQYYLHQGYLYNVSDAIRVGTITEHGFTINGKSTPFTHKPVQLTKEPVSDEYPDFYLEDNGNSIYKVIGKNLVQAVGSRENNEISLW